MPNVAKGEVRWTEHGAVPIALVLGLVLLCCDHDVVKTWQGGGRIEAKVSAETCPDAGVAAPAIRHKPHGVRGECKEYEDGGFTVFTHLKIIERLESGQRAPYDRDEVWKIGCFSGLCEAAVLSSSALASDEALQSFQLEAWRGRVASRRGSAITLKFDGMADQRVTIDLAAKSIAYKQTFKSGATAVGDGLCAGLADGDARR